MKPYTDPTTGEWVGEFETRLPNGDVDRKTEFGLNELGQPKAVTT